MKNGFTLIEFIIYLMLFSIIVLLTSQWLVLSVGPLQKNNNILRDIVSLHTAHDVFMRDMISAPSHIDQWLERNSDLLIWRKNSTHIGWQIKNNRLIRISGNYDGSQWHKKTQSLIAHNLDAVFTLHIVQDHVDLIQCDLATKKDNQKVRVIAVPRVGK